MWARLGKVGVFSEPFMGTGVMLMNSPYGPAPREVCCDLNAFIPNFYRSVKYDYQETARWADWPTLHHDLTAWHRWLLAWGAEHAHLVSEDPEYYDPKVAGRWVWGQSSWIGHGWCDGAKLAIRVPGDELCRWFTRACDSTPDYARGRRQRSSGTRYRACTAKPARQSVSQQRAAAA